ncbi:MAG: hypothetical protein P8Z38_09345 [Robiginitalea sp.]
MKQPPSEKPNKLSGDPGSREDFQAAQKGNSPPRAWSDPFRALWWDARGEWEAAHEIAQDLPTAWGSWMHAYLHRKEGDYGNAGYWYRKAGVPEWRDSLQAEFESLLRALLDADGNAV